MVVGARSWPRHHRCEWAGRNGSVRVAIITAKIIPFNSAIHSVIGGKMQIRTVKRTDLGTLGDEGPRTIAGAIMQTGPSMYMPAKTHVHFGQHFEPNRLAVPRAIRPNRGRRFNVNTSTFSFSARATTMTGSQNESPPIAIQ